MFFQSGVFFAKLSEINFCFSLKTLIEINLVFLKIFNFEDFTSSENKTKGGESESDENEFIVFPYKTEFLFVAITVIPVENFDNAFLKFCEFTFFINLFA